MILKDLFNFKCIQKNVHVSNLHKPLFSQLQKQSFLLKIFAILNKFVTVLYFLYSL